MNTNNVCMTIDLFSCCTGIYCDSLHWGPYNSLNSPSYFLRNSLIYHIFYIMIIFMWFINKLLRINIIGGCCFSQLVKAKRSIWIYLMATYFCSDFSPAGLVEHHVFHGVWCPLVTPTSVLTIESYLTQNPFYSTWGKLLTETVYKLLWGEKGLHTHIRQAVLWITWFLI